MQQSAFKAVSFHSGHLIFDLYLDDGTLSANAKSVHDEQRRLIQEFRPIGFECNVSKWL